MLRTVTRLTPTGLFPFIGRRNEHDYDTFNHPMETPKTGFDRVKAMFTKNNYGEVSIELHTVCQSTLCGFFIGACFGGLVQSKDAYLYFIENNQATIYKSTAQAKKKLQDYVTVAFAKGAYTWGWKLGIFTGMFSLIATMVSVYRDDTSIVEYITAGALTGAIYKANLGLAAALVGAGLGAVLSTAAGLAILGILKASGVTMDDIRKALYKIKVAREKQYSEAEEKASTIKNDQLTMHHDMVVQQRGEIKIQSLN